MRPLTLLLCASALSLLLPTAADAGRSRNDAPPNPPHEATGHLTWASPQSNPIALSPDGSLVAVVNTTSNSVDFIDTSTQSVTASIEVGMEPVSVAFKPNGEEAWVSNHVSDSVSVIDTLSGSGSRFQVVETLQDLDGNGVTQFDEPVGIAFKGDGSQAYVALSSRNDIAVVDTASYSVTTPRLHVTAQDPRALTVQGNRLYVLAFESSNESELSACENLSDDTRPGQCTLDGADFGTFVQSPNIPGETKNIMIDDDLPDRDLFVYDLDNNPPTLIESVEAVGTLLYGIAVDANHRVYVTQADARNAVNGNTIDPQGPTPAPGDVNDDGDVNLADLDNLMFENEITLIDCNGGCGSPSQVALGGATHASALATPFGVAVSNNGATVVATAAASSRVFTTDSSGNVLSQIDVGAIPRGLALVSDGGGAPQTAYVLNTLDDTVTVLDVSDPNDLPGNNPSPTVIAVGADPTPNAVRLGRIAFNNAFASDSGNFACASCHPDGNTDQLLWRIGGECFTTGCVSGEDEARTTMPIRGLRDSLPLHWDGTLGDPFGGGNGAVGFGGSGGSDCNLSNPSGMHDCFVDLVDGSLSGVMCDQSGACPAGGNQLSGQEIDDMATFLERVSYPPARSRPMSDVVSTAGFSDFFMDQGGFLPDPDTCADSDAGCHEFPHGAGTNSSTLGGFDVPTMRGMTDRYIQFSLGITGTQEILEASDTGLSATIQGFPINGPPNPFPWNSGANGYEEDTTFGAAFVVFGITYNLFPHDMLQMFEEASTGHSGALGRQVTLNTANTVGCPVCSVEDTLIELEAADEAGLVNLQGSALFFGASRTLSYDEVADLYRFVPGSATRTRAALITNVQSGKIMATLTAQLRSGISEDTPQPLLIPEGANCGSSGTTGDPELPSGTSFTVESKYVTSSDVLVLDGQPVSGTISVNAGGAPGNCSDEVGQDLATITLSSSPGSGTHLLQVQTADGLLSNEVPFTVP